MAIRNLSELHITVEAICQSLRDCDARLISNAQSYEEMRAEARQSFTDSQNYWKQICTENIRRTTASIENIKAEIDERVNGLISLERQLKQVDKSYARRADVDFKVRPQASTVESSVSYREQIEKVFREAKQIATECSLTAKAAPIQELGMLFSSKRESLYSRLYDLIQEAKHLRDLASRDTQSRIASCRSENENTCKREIARAAQETAELIKTINIKEQEAFRQIIEDAHRVILSIFPSDDLRLIDELTDLIQPDQLNLPASCFEYLQLGNYVVPLSEYVKTEAGMQLAEQVFSGHIIDGNVVFPAILYRLERANLCFDDGATTNSPGKSVIHAVMYRELLAAPASLQTFTLFNPGGAGHGYDSYLALLKLHPEIASGKIYTVQNQMRQELDDILGYIEDVGQNQFVGYKNIYEYNEAVSDKPVSLRTLCILDFPQYFDEHMLETLLSIIKNGNQYGVNVLLQYVGVDNSEVRGNGFHGLLQRILAECATFNYATGYWFTPQNIVFMPVSSPTEKELREFEKNYSVRYQEIKNTVLGIEKTLSMDEWFTGNSALKISIPIGKNEDGAIQNLEFGDVIGVGTSHYALITGSTGSGKSTLLHTIILNSITKYNPDEINLYLLDFKSGTEFKIYAEYNIPHIKLIALDAMQEFGQSILNELWNIMQNRVKLFESVPDADIKNIQQYRQATGERLPRILVIMDEFQILFNEENNRRVAYEVGSKMADFVSLARVYGIHFILSTQTMSRLSSGFSIRKATLNEMHVRIGLQSTIEEARLLFGDTYGTQAFQKMGTGKGSGIYVENDARPKLVSFKGAFCDEDQQRGILENIVHRYSVIDNDSKPVVFRGDSVPSLSECEGFCNPEPDEIFSSVPIYLGEPIKIAAPICVNINRLRRSNLLIVGSNQEMLDRLVSLYILNAVKTHPSNNNITTDTSVFLIDGLSIMGERMSQQIAFAYEFSLLDIRKADSNSSALTVLEDVYAIFQKRHQERLSGKTKPFNTIHFIINNFQWVDVIRLIIDNKNVDEYRRPENRTEALPSSTLFDFIPTSDPNDCSALLDSLIADTAPKHSGGNISPNEMFMTLLESGYTCGINVVMSCSDFLTVKEHIYDVVPKFQNRIVFALSDGDADRLIQDAKTEKLKNNIVIFSDGINPSLQFKPYGINI